MMYIPRYHVARSEIDPSEIEPNLSRAAPRISLRVWALMSSQRDMESVNAIY